MKRGEYLQRALQAFDDGRIDEETYDAMLMNADVFCDDDDDCGLPRTYAEIEYTSEQLESESSDDVIDWVTQWWIDVYDCPAAYNSPEEYDPDALPNEYEVMKGLLNCLQENQ